VGLDGIFAALFPCGSVTGAPKLQAMRQIRALEPEPRGVYCGAVGVVRPGGVATFNVAIRTVTVRGPRWRCGIGSDITTGSTAEGEWAEWRQKRGFLERAREPFEILETFLLRDGQPQHADLHMARMAQTAKHFGYTWQPQAWHDALHKLAQNYPGGNWRVRLLLDADGRLQAEAFAFQPSEDRVRLQLADQAFEEAGSEFTRFKTTRRAHYEAHAPRQPDVFDTLLWNAAGELTECTRGNIAVQLDGQWCTPSLRCGLLNGVQRQIGLSSGRLMERVIGRDALEQAQGLVFLNSLRGWLPARLGAVDDKAIIAESVAWT
jgi:para-aminobenzoate synthetase/4-amino-4-deoxychorismate lyase